MTKLEDVQEGLGQTGRFGEFFVGLGALIGLGGGLLLASGLSNRFAVWPLTADTHPVDAIQSGILFLLCGVGFIFFGIMAMMSGWARHHPGFEER